MFFLQVKLKIFLNTHNKKLKKKTFEYIFNIKYILDNYLDISKNPFTFNKFIYLKYLYN